VALPGRQRGDRGGRTGAAMKTIFQKARAAFSNPRRRRLLLLGLLLGGVPLLGCATVLAFWTLPLFRAHLFTVLNPDAARGMIYFHDTVRSVPWSMHVVKISRTRPDLKLESMIGQGACLGMATLPEQVRRLPPEWGRPVAAVNGDLFNNHPDYPGDPEGLQIVHGELVSGPSPTRVCFWIDAQGQPHRGDVRSRFQVTWPEGATTPFGLNEARLPHGAVLYTAAVGSATRTRGGLELILKCATNSPALPLQIGRTYTARIREIRSAGNTPLSRDTLVLSLGPELLGQVPTVAVGDVLKLSTATSPELHDVQMAIGGGPTLVEGGKTREWTGLPLRHPRTALGWNREALFLVEVDGRQLRLSAGMTLAELADYLIKLGCDEAMNLDGGGSATCWVYGNVMNSPSQGRERPAANGLVVLQTRLEKKQPFTSR
jgi:hypothetical protein